MFYMRIMQRMIRKSITTKSAIMSLALGCLLVSTAAAADGDGFECPELEEMSLYWKGVILLLVFLVGLLAVAMKSSKRSHQED
ncbi:MAG: hypothetical protein KAR11_06650 [Phycisphaerae bacterium]|nr:hypothetical protein [Phycisphaerae bacterium]